MINGNPVVVGNNPPMKEFVETNHYGVSVDSDGSDVEKIVDGIKIILNSPNDYKCFNVDNVLWDKQNDVINRIVNTFLK